MPDLRTYNRSFDHMQSFLLFQAIRTGAQFYASEDDFLPSDVKIKKETTPSTDIVTSASAPVASSSSASSRTPSKRPRRPRRSAASAVKSYVVPDSDDEAIAEEQVGENVETSGSHSGKKRVVETSLQKWIRHLTALQKGEIKKYNEEKKQIHKQAAPGPKLRVPKVRDISLSISFRCFAC